MSHEILRDNGLTIVLLLFFTMSIVGQWLTGWQVVVSDAIQHHQKPIGLGAYAFSPQFLAAVFENWESEFLQMSAYVILTAILFQHGSAESKDPDEPPRDHYLEGRSRDPKAPSILRAGPFWRAIYARSLGLALGLLFILSFVLHWYHSARAAAEEAIEHGQVPATTIAYLGQPELWFESFQNWQSEFLSTAVLVVLSIFLRQRESPESKPVSAPHSQTGS